MGSLATPFAAGQTVRFSDAAERGGAGVEEREAVASGGGATGPAPGGLARRQKRQLSTRLSSLVLDDAFDNVLPLSPSLDNFLNLATTCLNGQTLLPGRLFSSSAGRSLSGMESLDLNWLVEGGGGGSGLGGAGLLPVGDGAAAGATAAPNRPEGGRLGEGEASGNSVPAGHGQGLPPTGRRRRRVQQDQAEAGGAATPTTSVMVPQPPPSPQTLPAPPALRLHSTPVTSGAPGLAPSPAAYYHPGSPRHGPGGVAVLSGTGTRSEGGGGGTPRAAMQSPTPTLSGTGLAPAAGQQAQPAEQEHRAMELSLLCAGASGMGAGAAAPPSPFLQSQHAAAQAYHQQMLAYLQQSGAGADPALLAQFGSAASSQMAWSGLGTPEGSAGLSPRVSSASYSTAMAAAAYAQAHQAAAAVAAAAAGGGGLGGPGMAPPSPRTLPTAIVGAPLTPESAMAAAAQAEAWAQHAQQVEAWCQQQQAAAVLQAYRDGAGAALGQGPVAAELAALAQAAGWGNAGFVSSPYGPSALPTQPPSSMPFQVRVCTAPSFRVSTVNPVKLSQSNSAANYPPQDQ